MYIKSIADLQVGEKGTIKEFQNEEISLKLLEMGCLPNAEVEVTQKAPFGDPICIRVADYQLSLRRREAHTVLVQ
ncbi:MAG: ferrous iron transport protein A [Thermonemataceae bacterium]